MLTKDENKSQHEYITKLKVVPLKGWTLQACGGISILAFLP